MSEAENTRVVQDAYAAFGRGDIPALLGYFTDDIQWQPVIGTARHVPFSGVRTGKTAVAEFFAIGHYRARTRATGRTFDSPFAMVFTFRNGKVAAFREFTDSAAINAAFA